MFHIWITHNFVVTFNIVIALYIGPTNYIYITFNIGVILFYFTLISLLYCCYTVVI